MNAPTVSPSHCLGLGDKRQQENKETWRPNQHSLSLGQQVESFCVEEPFLGTFTWRYNTKLLRISSADEASTAATQPYLLPFPFPHETIYSQGVCNCVLTAKQNLLRQYFLCCCKLSSDPNKWHWWHSWFAAICRQTTAPSNSFKLIHQPHKDIQQQACWQSRLLWFFPDYFVSPIILSIWWWSHQTRQQPWK